MQAMRHLGSWGLALFLIFMFVQATIHPLPNPPEGSVKLFDAPGQNIVFATLAANTGFTMLEPTGRVVVAIAELLAAFLLLLPMTRRTGAGLSIVILGGAVAAHLMPDVLGREVPLSLAANADTDGGKLFALAIAMLAASVLLFVLHPRNR
ncbi:MAG: hypothetical protein VXW22_02735 [Pseudomonadota bacterium]|jgi:uncharacterized membrane protein YphA (DoxX/SURF4 family)|nr:hypothetical protein [Pseudomonadota bacterium]